MKDIIANRPRDSRGVFLPYKTDDEIKATGKKWRDEYYGSHPWLKHLAYARSRCYKSGREIALTREEIKALWIRDDACILISPSIDRIDNRKGYLYENCRFIERSLNSSIAHKDRVITDKQRRASSNNLSEYWRKKRCEKSLTVQ